MISYQTEVFTFVYKCLQLTAYLDNQTLQRVEQTESFDYLLKPFEEAELQTAIKKTLHRYRVDRK